MYLSCVHEDEKGSCESWHLLEDLATVDVPEGLEEDTSHAIPESIHSMVGNLPCTSGILQTLNQCLMAPTYVCNIVVFQVKLVISGHHYMQTNTSVIISIGKKVIQVKKLVGLPPPHLNYLGVFLRYIRAFAEVNTFGGASAHEF